MTKRGSSFRMRVVMYLRGELAWDFLLGGVFYTLRDVVRIYVLFFFGSYITLLYISLVTTY